MEKIVAGICIGALVIAGTLGMYWLLWLLWCWVLPQVWASGPSAVVRPGYWLFAGCWFLVMLIGKGIFCGSTKA